MTDRPGSDYVETLVIGGGQAGLATAYHLSRRGLDHAVLDANDRIGDAWRNRWDSLRLFTPSWFNGLPGMPFPGYSWAFPSKDEMADYLEHYAAHFEVPVETGVRVERLSREDGLFVAIAGDRRFRADNVVVAMSSWQKPRIPEFADELDPSILQLHVSRYANPTSSKQGASSLSEPATREPRSPRSWRGPARCGCPGPTPGPSPSAPRACRRASSCASSEGSSSIVCSPPAHRSGGGPGRRWCPAASLC